MTRGERATEHIWAEERIWLLPKIGIESTGKDKEMKNVKQKRIHRLKRLREDWRAPREWNWCSKQTQALGRKRGGRAGKTKATWKGEPMNNLKRKHWLKESKGFTRVGWILDYGLRFQEEKRVGRWEKKATEAGETTSLRKSWGLISQKTKSIKSSWREMDRMKRAENPWTKN